MKRIGIVMVMAVLIMMINACHKEEPKQVELMEVEASCFLHIDSIITDSTRLSSKMRVINSSEDYRKMIGSLGFSEMPLRFNPESSSMIMVGKWDISDIKAEGVTLVRSRINGDIRVCLTDTVGVRDKEKPDYRVILCVTEKVPENSKVVLYQSTYTYSK